MISIPLIIIICFSHWIADFVFQTDWMARNKSKSNTALMAHILTYSTILGICLSPFLFSIELLAFVVINAVLHFTIDWCSSRVTSKLHRQNKMGSATVPNFGFFSIIGLDQFAHMSSLFITFGLIFL